MNFSRIFAGSSDFSIFEKLLFYLNIHRMQKEQDSSSFFEMSFELAWNVLKDCLEREGFVVNSPRSAIKQAFQSGLLEDGHVWMEALTDRNLTVHTYEEEIALAVERKIRDVYFPALLNLKNQFESREE